MNYYLQLDKHFVDFAAHFFPAMKQKLLNTKYKKCPLNRRLKAKNRTDAVLGSSVIFYI